MFEDTQPTLDTPPPSLVRAEGPVVGRYRLATLLGRGSIGEVHVALDIVSGQPVALKLIRLSAVEAGDARDARRRFAAEAEAMRQLQHPAIVRIFGAGSDGDQAWLAMELLGGCDLIRYTRPARRLPEVVTLRLIERIARGLAYAHEFGIVHRDIKPANVMVDWATDRVTLTDFGLARLADAEGTRTGLVLGSPAYMSPEQLAGGPATPAGDLYACGVTLFQLLAGRLPHEDSSMGELLRRVAREPAPDITSLEPGLPKELGVIVARLLSKRPDERGSAQGLADELHRLRETMHGALPAAAGGPMSRA